MTVGSQVKTCYASMKSIEAGLSILRNQTNELKARDTYKEAESIIKEINQDLERQLLMLIREEPQYNK